MGKNYKEKFENPNNSEIESNVKIEQKESEDWKSNSNLTDIIREDDDLCSLGSSDVQGEGLDDLEYDELGNYWTQEFASYPSIEDSMYDSTYSSATSTCSVSETRCFNC